MNRAPITPTHHDRRVVTSRVTNFATAMEIVLNLRNEKRLCAVFIYPFNASDQLGEWIVVSTFQVAQ